MFGSALLGRLSYGMVSLAMVLTVKESTGSYATAGTVMAAFGLASVLLSPARAALVDRYGPRRALPPMAAACALFLAVLAAVSSQPGAPGPLLVVLAVAAATCTPPLGPVMRSLWSRLAPEPSLLQRAYSLDSVAEELLFVTGPLLVAALVKLTTPATALAVSAALMLSGTLALVSSPATGPAPRQEQRSTPPRSWLPSGRGLLHAGAVAFAVGVGLGAVDLLAIAFADRLHQVESVAWVLAALSAGSAIGGLTYGSITWRKSAQRRLSLLATGLGLALAAAGLAPNLYVLTAAAALTGLFVAPTITTAYLLANHSAAPGTGTQAGAWVNTALNAGSATGTAVAGMLVAQLSLPVCFALMAVPSLLTAVTPVTPTRAGTSS
ncbi:MFS transporter [Streptomyces sp. NRRL WC-3742]|uniref:MFS transporter n=1 Tax=Streptomyces sp. NRRL WC-3742 TaxID=1463934 RepID=UPI0005699E67|nr:MFS transporter [Streptomyces sp. NRRL WC-3742]